MVAHKQNKAPATVCARAAFIHHIRIYHTCTLRLNNKTCYMCSLLQTKHFNHNSCGQHYTHWTLGKINSIRTCRFKSSRSTLLMADTKTYKIETKFNIARKSSAQGKRTWDNNCVWRKCGSLMQPVYTAVRSISRHCQGMRVLWVEFAKRSPVRMKTSACTSLSRNYIRYHHQRIETWTVYWTDRRDAYL